MSTSPASLPDLAVYAAPFGGCFVTICVAFILYGVTTAQAYACLRKYPKDSTRVKAVVVIAWLIETIHTAFCIEFTYQYLIIGYGNPLVLAQIHWSTGFLMVTTLLVVFLVHSFFVHRVWVLSNHHIVAVAIPTIMVFVNTGFDVAITILLYKYKTWEAFHTHVMSTMTVYVASVLLVTIDILVTSTLIYYLHKRRTGYTRTNHLIYQLEMYIVNSGAITIAASMSVLLTFALMSDNLLYAGLEQILCKLYNNALLATLNAREVKGHQSSNGTSSERNEYLEDDLQRGTSPRVVGRQYNIYVGQQWSVDTTAADPPTELKNISAEKVHAVDIYRDPV